MAAEESKVEESPQPLSPLPGHALTFYRALHKASSVETLDKEKIRLYRGSIVAAFDLCGISRGHYGTTKKLLEDVGSISVLQKGNPRQESVVHLLGEPDLDALTAKFLLTPPSGRGRVRGLSVEYRVDQIERRLSGLDIVAAIKNLDDRLSAIEQRNRE